MGKNINERLREVRKYLGITQKEMAALLTMQQSYYSEVENNKRSVTGKLVENLNKLKSISSDWMYTGKGEMIITNSDIVKNNVGKQKIGILRKKTFETTLSKEDQNLIIAIRELPELSEMLKKIIDIIDIESLENLSSIGAAWRPGKFKPDYPFKKDLTNEAYEYNMSAFINHLSDYKKPIIEFRKQLRYFLNKVKPLDKEDIIKIPED